MDSKSETLLGQLDRAPETNVRRILHITVGLPAVLFAWYQWDSCVAQVQESPETITQSLLYTTTGLLAVLFIWYQWNRRRTEKMIKKLPGPPTWPIIGNAHLFLGLDMNGIFKKQMDLMAQYGTSIRLWLGPYLWVNLAEPRHLEAILTSQFAKNKDPTYQPFKDQSDGIFTASDENWKRLRKLVDPAFNQRLLEHFTKYFNEQSKILVNILEKKVDGPEFDIHEYVSRCTLDILCGTLMGVTSFEQSENTSNFAKNLLLSTETANKRYFLLPDFIFRLTDLSRQNMKFNHHLHKFVKNIIQQRKLAKKKEQSVTNDFLKGGDEKTQIFLDSILDHFKNLSDDELVIKITDMFIAGSAKTAVGISYALMLMGTHPEIQEKVYKEAVEIIGTGDDDITVLNLPKFTYLEMVLKEVLRHYTVPHVVRKLDEDHFIGDMTLPAGTSVQLSIHEVHRDPRYWSHPHEFYPDHFLPENVVKRPKFSYIPFSFGPRNCPGHSFAMMSMKTVVAAVIRKYKITSNFDMKSMQYKNVFMLEPQGGYPIQISKR